MLSDKLIRLVDPFANVAFRRRSAGGLERLHKSGVYGNNELTLSAPAPHVPWMTSPYITQMPLESHSAKFPILLTEAPFYIRIENKSLLSL